MIPMTDPVKDPWSVWIAQVKFSDDTGIKNRPVIVLKDNIVVCICMEVTSQTKDQRHGYKIKNTKFANLNKESWVKFEQIEIDPDKFCRMIGMLNVEDIIGLKRWMTSRYNRFD